MEYLEQRAALTGRVAAVIGGAAGIGEAVKRWRLGLAMSRAHRFARLTRALSVAMPVLAYICRYSFETRTNPIRDFRLFTHLARAQIFLKL